MKCGAKVKTIYVDRRRLLEIFKTYERAVPIILGNEYICRDCWISITHRLFTPIREVTVGDYWDKLEREAERQAFYARLENERRLGGRTD